MSRRNEACIAYCIKSLARSFTVHVAIKFQRGTIASPVNASRWKSRSLWFPVAGRSTRFKITRDKTRTCERTLRNPRHISYLEIYARRGETHRRVSIRATGKPSHFRSKPKNFSKQRMDKVIDRFKKVIGHDYDSDRPIAK